MNRSGFVVALSMHKKLTRTLVALCLIVLSFQSLAQSKPLVLYGNQSLAPFIFADGQQVSGLAVDMLHEINRRTGLNMELRATEWQDAQQLVRDDQAQGLIYLNKSDERKQWLAFSRPFLTSEFVMFTHKSSTHVYRPEEAAGITLGYESAGFGESVLSRFKNAKSLAYANIADMLTGLENGDIDLAIADKWAGLYALSQLNIQNVIAVGRPLASEDTFIAVAKQYEDILIPINRALYAMEQDGSKNQILGKWSGERVVYFTQGTLFNYIALGGIVLLIGLLFAIFYYIKLNRALKLSWLNLESRNKQLHRLMASKDKVLTSRVQFLANVSHEVKTPLNGLVNGLELVERDGMSVHNKSIVTKLDTCAKQLQQVIDNTLQSSSLLRHAAELDAKSCEILSLLKAKYQEYRYKTRNYEAAFTLDLPTSVDVLRVICDAEKINLILNHLLDNAFKFSTQTAVTLRCELIHQEEQEVHLVISVIDQGPGIDEDIIDDLFDPFFMVDAGHNRRYSGTGLGLSICKSVSALMNADLQVRSEHGKGSCFSLHLSVPLDVQQELSTNYPKQHDKAYKFKILIVEDNEINAELLMSMLSSETIQCFWAKNGVEAIKYSERSQFDLIFMDLQMPIMDGFQATQHLRKQFDKNELPIVAVTASNFESDRLNTQRIGMNEHLNKPMTKTMLSDILERYLGIALNR